jgi:uncharacterized protein YciW
VRREGEAEREGGEGKRDLTASLSPIIASFFQPTNFDARGCLLLKRFLSYATTCADICSYNQLINFYATRLRYFLSCPSKKSADPDAFESQQSS